MSYISCFSGIGGLEANSSPKAYCEIDRDCLTVLEKKFPRSKGFNDIANLRGVTADLVVGGWPCQDLSIAGKQRGLSGANSGLFYSLVAVAVAARSTTIVAENVPNLLNLSNGEVFREVLRELSRNGFTHCAWRTLNARQFGLPHHRSRIFIVASKEKQRCLSIFRELPKFPQKRLRRQSAGFYWTAGSQSICYSVGYVPTIKVGTGLSIASPPAVHYNGVVRQLSAFEALSLQGFDPKFFSDLQLKTTSLLKMAGNAVALPVGTFVVDGVLRELQADEVVFKPMQTDLFGGGHSVIPKNGYCKDDVAEVMVEEQPKLADGLSDFLDFESKESLSARAAAGLVARLVRSGLSCPPNLMSDLLRAGAKGNAAQAN